MKAYVMNGVADEPMSVLDVKRAALANLAAITGPHPRLSQAMHRPGVSDFRERNLDALEMIADAFPGFSDRELGDVPINATITGVGIGAKKKAKGDLEQMWDKVQPALAKAGDDVLKNEVVQAVTRNNPIMAAARMAFQITVQENVGGIARMMVADPKTEEHVRKVWEGLGGKWDTLQKAIAKGRSKEPQHAMGALPASWDLSGWRNLTALDLLRESLPPGMPVEWFAPPGGLHGVDQYGDVENDGGGSDRPRSGSGIGSAIADILKAAGPVIGTVLNAYGKQPPAEVAKAMDAAKDGSTALISKETLDALLRAGVGAVQTQMTPAPIFYPPPAPRRLGPRVVPRRVAAPVAYKGAMSVPGRSGGSGWIFPVAILAALTLSKK